MIGRPRMTEKFSWEEICDKILVDVGRENDNKFKEWLLSKEQKRFFDSRTYLVCYEIYKKITCEQPRRDHFLVVTSKEGSGKSTLAAQIASLVDPSFNANRVFFEPGKWFDFLSKAEPGQACQLDEGNLFLFSREALTGNNKRILKIMALMRQKQTLTIICVPNFWTMDTYVRKHRVDCTYYISKPGKFIYLNEFGTKYMGDKGSAKQSLSGLHFKPDVHYFGSNIADFPACISPEDYSSKKLDNFQSLIDDAKKDLTANLVEKKVAEPFYGLIEASKILNLNRGTVSKMLRSGEIKARKYGVRWRIPESELRVK